MGCATSPPTTPKRTGQPTLRLIDPAGATEGQERAVKAVTVGGFNVYAGRAIDGRDRKRLERELRYVGRPPLAQHRLEELPDGRVRYRMKRPWKDGTTSIVFDPLDLISRLAALVPPPRFNLIRYHGVLAPGAKLRSRIVPAPTEAGRPAQLDLFNKTPHYLDGSKYRLRWAAMLRRTFREDLEVCVRCGGRVRIVQYATCPEELHPLLERFGEPLEAPLPHPARPPPQLELDWFDEPARAPRRSPGSSVPRRRSERALRAQRCVSGWASGAWATFEDQLGGMCARRCAPARGSAFGLGHGANPRPRAARGRLAEAPATGCSARFRRSFGLDASRRSTTRSQFGNKGLDPKVGSP